LDCAGRFDRLKALSLSKGKAQLRRRFFHGDVTLGALSASRFAKSREAERRKRVALRLPPHSKKHHCDGTQA